jgi:hypothetical protein
MDELAREHKRIEQEGAGLLRQVEYASDPRNTLLGRRTTALAPAHSTVGPMISRFTISPVGT